jgi:hypothetical protein
MLSTKFWFIWTIAFRREEFKKSANQKQELPVVCMFVNGSGRNEQSLQGAGSSINASYKDSVQLANRFRREELKKSANQRQKSPAAAMFANASGRNEQS